MKEVYDYIQESPKLYISLVHQVQLYYDGYAPLLLLSGGVSVKRRIPCTKSKTDIYDKENKTEYEFYTDVLLKKGVPHDAIICENKSGHIGDNAF